MRSGTLWRRISVALGLMTVVALAALLTFDLVTERTARAAARSFEEEIGPLSLASLMKPELEHDANAATWIRAGGAALALSPEQANRAAELIRIEPSDWGDAELAAAGDLLEASRPAVEILSRALPLEESNFEIDYSAGWKTEIPALLPLLHVTRILRIDGRLAVLEGDADRVLGGAALTGRIGDALADESLLIVALIGLAVDRQAIGILHEAVTLLDPEDLESAAAALERRDRTRSFARALRGEAAVIASTPVTEWLQAYQVPRFLHRPLRTLARGWHQRQVARLNDGYRRMIQSLDRPFDDDAEPIRFPGPLAPNLESTVDRLRETESARRLAWSALVTYRRALADNAYPERPILAAGTEPDLYAGGPVRYEVRPDGSAVLAADAADERWRGLNTGRRRLPGPPWVWRLPAID